MAKTKTGVTVPNRHLYSRLSYLYQAAAFLGSEIGNSHDTKPGHSAMVCHKDQGSPPDPQSGHAADQMRLNLARHLLTGLRATSLKSQIRLSPAIKHTFCKLCDTLLIEGETSTSIVENKSKHGRKPWADVLVVKCNTCGGLKRFPLHAPRQKRRPQRQQVTEGISKASIEGHTPVDKMVDVVMRDH